MTHLCSRGQYWSMPSDLLSCLSDTLWYRVKSKMTKPIINQLTPYHSLETVCFHTIGETPMESSQTYRRQIHMRWVKLAIFYQYLAISQNQYKTYIRHSYTCRIVLMLLYYVTFFSVFNPRVYVAFHDRLLLLYFTRPILRSYSGRVIGSRTRYSNGTIFTEIEWLCIPKPSHFVNFALFFFYLERVIKWRQSTLNGAWSESCGILTFDGSTPPYIGSSEQLKIRTSNLVHDECQLYVCKFPKRGVVKVTCHKKR